MGYLNPVLNFLNKARRKINHIRNSNLNASSERDHKFLENAYREILDREIDKDGLNNYTKYLSQGYSQTEILINLIKSEEFINKVLRENSSIQTGVDSSESDRLFLENTYKNILGREIDEEGLNHYINLLKNRHSRTDIIINLIKSEEFINKVISENHVIQNLRELRPSKYQIVGDILEDRKALVFTAETQEDFDWLESMILEHGYYEKPGVWSFGINTDKRVMAEIMSAFKPKKALEIGCANGALIQCLHEMNIVCEGVEISTRAIEKAFPQIKKNIHKGDLLELQLSSSYDLIIGLDIFEHLNPNKLGNYLSKIFALLNDGGYLFCNIPAFGFDPIFGTVFPIYIKEWEADISQAQIFSKLHVDKDGYPINGHLIWADSQWWVKQFEQLGFQREEEIEQAFHQKYDNYMNKTSIARKSYYVFSRSADKEENKGIIDLIKSTPSQILKS